MRVVGARGWAIVSDIDDTIKITGTLSIEQVLRNTFAEDPKPTPKFEGFYAHLNRVFNEPAWFYLSASPYNLYPFLHAFIKKHYPLGHLILRDMSWMSIAGLFNSVSVGTEAYKTAELQRVLGKWLPTRKYILIGDSTQKDPEAYAATYKAYPETVKAIWIRVVTGVDEDEEREQNSQQRFEKTFRDVPKNIWKTFYDTDELAGLAEKLIRG
jgi:phosphatidate phosphatase APP1